MATEPRGSYQRIDLARTLRWLIGSRILGDLVGGKQDSRVHGSIMLFTQPTFLFVFLPVLLGLYFSAPHGARNAILTIASLLFYAVGEIRFLPFMVLSIAINFVLAIWIERHRSGRWARTILSVGIASDLILLLVFKYTGWIVECIDQVLGALGLGTLPAPTILLPLGISFFTFHKISYKIDVYRGVTRAQRNPLTLALYILFFPQLIAGPIVRYHDISDQQARRAVERVQVAEGITGHSIRLADNVLIGNTVHAVATGVLRAVSAAHTAPAAWTGIACYTLQIYFDFSGYSDMAIGLALLFGFRFLENFDHPYASRSITEFWRRWHISLSRWFRDYLYIPLGGNRDGGARTYRNLVSVFFLCGLWHGASWEFVVWGLFHGGFLVVERLGLGRILERLPRPATHVYALFVVMVGWVFFRAGSLGKAFGYLAAMFGLGEHGEIRYSPSVFLNSWTTLIFVIGVVACFPVRRWLSDRLTRPALDGSRRLPAVVELWSTIGLFALFYLSLMLIAAGTYNPFLYFRF